MKKLQILIAAFMMAVTLPACAPASVDCASKAVFCVGLVTDFGKVTDHALNQSAWEGVQQAQKEFGAEVQYIETVNSKDYAKNIAAFGDSGYDVIVTVGFDLSEATAAAAAQYPNTDFIGVDQFQSEPVDRVAGLNFPEDQAGFLAGALAALMSRSHQIGAVCSTDEVPAIWRLGEGYKAGALYVDKLNQMTTAVYVIYHSDNNDAFIDPQWGTETADTMIKQGADVIFGCGGATGDGAITTAAQAETFVIGVNTDQYFTLPQAAPHMISSAMELVAPGVFDLIKLARDDMFPNGNFFGHVGFAPFHDLENEVPPDVKETMETITNGLRDSTIKTDVLSAKP